MGTRPSDVRRVPACGGLHVSTDILVMDDEPDIQDLIQLNLEWAGHRVAVAGTVSEAEDAMRRVLPDLILLDWLLPGTPGVEWARRLRSTPATRHVPIIMLSARAGEQDKIVGLDAGVDDYVTKPFSPRELVSRIAAVLRRRAPQLTDESVEIDRLYLNHASHVTTADGRPLHVGPTEFRMLQFFMTHPERMHTRAQLVAAIWGKDIDVEDRTVDVYVGRLRDSLKATNHDVLVETVRGGGYRFRMARNAEQR
jgi:two-component system, OmpR family, phosphate regulon response regulator PhoB